MVEIKRMQARDRLTNPIQGRVKWSVSKSLWYSGHVCIAVVGVVLTWSLENVVLAGLLTVGTLACGHSVGIHRLLIHRSFQCPYWLEVCLVYLGCLVGMGGPFKMLYLHDIRDWSQRHTSCHPYFTHQSGIWRDWWWQNHCQIELSHPPRFRVEEDVSKSRLYQWMDRYWMLLQIPLAIILYCFLGPEALIWGISVRIAVSLTGHWFVGYVTHNGGDQDWFLSRHAVQGYNSRFFGLLAMGEGWHNNHHAFPESARLGHDHTQPDPGWWFILLLSRLGLAWHITLPHHIPKRAELKKIAHKLSEITE